MRSEGGGIWDVAAYEHFSDHRLRPALDLIGRIPKIPDGDIIDLGCGSGAVAEALRSRFPQHRLIGVDAAPAMLEKAAVSGLYADLVEADINDWQPATPPALIFSNAAIHWLPGHEVLLPCLAGLLVPGGVLAVQAPNQLGEPSHQTLIQAAQAIRADLFGDWQPFPGVSELGDYADWLSGYGLDLWETTYHQRLAAQYDGAHPVRAFSVSTAGRPVMARLDSAEQAEFLAEWDRLLTVAYPLRPDGAVDFPFRRIFIVAKHI
ncbi:MAG: methyltransferase domain-containing protein [Pikeienuella sp.]